MTTRRKATKRGVEAGAFLNRLLGGPVTLRGLLEAIRLGEEETQAVFAAKLGISKAHLSDIEKGRRAVSAERAARFATLLGHSPERFVKLALQDEVARAGLHYTIEVHAA
jgi:transcriptional regulator with XRE-family HTH domain